MKCTVVGRVLIHKLPNVLILCNRIGSRACYGAVGSVKATVEGGLSKPDVSWVVYFVPTNPGEWIWGRGEAA